jgi:hypothetical protein
MIRAWQGCMRLHVAALAAPLAHALRLGYSGLTRRPVTVGAAAAGGDGGREAQHERHTRVAAGRHQVRRPRLKLVSIILGTVSVVRSPVCALAAVGCRCDGRQGLVERELLL